MKSFENTDLLTTWPQCLLFSWAKAVTAKLQDALSEFINGSEKSKAGQQICPDHQRKSKVASCSYGQVGPCIGKSLHIKAAPGQFLMPLTCLLPFSSFSSTIHCFFPCLNNQSLKPHSKIALYRSTVRYSNACTYCEILKTVEKDLIYSLFMVKTSF